MQESLNQIADAGDTLSDSGCRSLSIRQRMQETFYQAVDAEVSLSDCGCRKNSIRQVMQKPLVEKADAGNTFITQRMQDRDTSVSAV